MRPRYGFYGDQIIDICGAVFLLVGMAVSGLMSERVTLSLLLAVGNLVVLFKPFVSAWGYRFLLFDVVGVVGIVILGLVLVTSTTSATRTLYDIERV